MYSVFIVYVLSLISISSADLESDEQLKMPMVIEQDEISSIIETDSRPSSVEPFPKSARTGKQYKCPHCSYSADKKVNAHILYKPI